MTGYRIDALQYCNWSGEILAELRAGGLDAVHVTLAYHEDFRATVSQIVDWTARLRAHAGLIRPARTADDIFAARREGRTAILFGLQTPAPIEAEIGLVEVLHTLGVRIMQITYNSQSLLASGYTEAEDTGLTRMGREVVDEMNRLGMVIDLSHAGARSALAAIEHSSRPVAVTHANPRAWCDTPRNLPDTVLRALGETGGMLGLSLYPHHLAGGSDCTLEDFAAMVARTAEVIGPGRIGIGSDLCRGQPDAVVDWMRKGRWTRGEDMPPGRFPPQPAWFRDARDFAGLGPGLRAAGFSADEVDGILGDNWLRFLDAALRPAGPGAPTDG